ncbi:MAG: hypothetical protein M1822_003428 [Bathelium mastoideum]|nr:MAG: hypothetical protein M1822_003428 [Bathelium mastoideum]
MSRPRDRLAYRLRQLPQYLKITDVASFVVKVSADLGPEDAIQVFSLATSLAVWENPPTKIATLTFKTTPKVFDNDDEKWEVSARQIGWNRTLAFDVLFDGFTPLNDVDESNHLAESRGSQADFVWLRDQLPKDVPTCRQILYGYDTSLTSDESFQAIDDLATSFIGRLKSIGGSSLAMKPLIIFAHSLGGIIVKQSIVTLAGSTDVEKLMLEKIHSVFFFATPHLGMEMSHLLALVKDKPNESLIRVLSNDDSYLRLLDEQFSGIATHSRIRILSFYETKLSRAAEMSCQGDLGRTGDQYVAVKRNSAVHRYSEIWLPINRDHSDIVKFPRHNPDYEAVVAFLYNIVNSSSFGLSLPNEAAIRDRGPHTAAPFGAHNSNNAVIITEGYVNEFNLEERKIELRNLQIEQRDDTVLPNKMKLPSSDEAFLKLLERRIFDRGDLVSRLAEQVKEVETKIESRKSIAHVSKFGNLLTEEGLIESLYIPELGDRFLKIENSSFDTFAWIFEDTQLQFTNWLRGKTGTYWIRGKPGSGKSTLMKYLHNHPRTSMVWEPERLVINVWFFLDDRGTSIQKSLEGLLYAILHRVISSDNRLADILLPSYAMKPPDRRNSWSLNGLQSGLMILLNQKEFDVYINLFLDALDECNNPPEVMADFVASMSNRPDSRTRTKVCFASRLWSAFRDRFDHCPGFSMHDHTMSDIRSFARNAFIQNGLIADSNADLDNTGVLELVSDISRRAQGVFLWTKLVCTDLVNAHRNGTPIGNMLKLVSEFPQELDGYYARTVERLPKSSRFKSFVMLDILVKADHALDLKDFNGAVSCASCQTAKECIIEPMNSSSAIEKITRNIRDYTGGLIEVVATTQGPTVQFMHQTVKVFVSRPGFTRNLLGPEAKEIHENGHSFLAKYCIAKVVAARELDWRLTDQALLGLLHAHLSETTTGISQREFLDSLSAEDFRLHFQGLFYVVDSRFSLAVIADLRLYVREALDRSDHDKHQLSSSLLQCLTRFTSLRLYGLRDSQDLRTIQSSKDSPLPYGILQRVNMEHADMCRMLLQFTSNSGKRYDHSIAFKDLFIPIKALLREGCPSSSESRTIVRHFLEHQQDPGCTFESASKLPGTVHCKPIHLADAETSRLLLEFGADINAVDSSGRTALDIALDGFDSMLHRVSFIRVHDRILTLLDYGACVTDYSRHCDFFQLKKYLEFTEDELARWEHIPHIKDTQVQSNEH